MEKLPQQIELIGETIRMVPLCDDHQTGLSNAVTDGNLWELYFTSAPYPSEMSNYIKKAQEEYQNQNSYPFVVIQNSDNKIVGTSRFMNLDLPNNRLEIGHTWYSKSVQRTKVNTECKLLLLQYAFETLECIAVELRTHHENYVSQKAIERLGAQLDGILRNHKYDKNGNLRNTFVYSIIKSEWLEIKKNLILKLQKNY